MTTAAARPSRWAWVPITLVLVAAAAGGLVLLAPYTWTDAYICSRCALGGDVQRKQLPTRWDAPLDARMTFWKGRLHETPTALGGLLASEGIVEAHAHEWVFCQGVGMESPVVKGSNPNYDGTIALMGERGDGFWMRSDADSQLAVPFVRDLLRAGLREEVARWTSFILSPKTSQEESLASLLLKDPPYPVNGFVDPRDFATWAQEGLPRLKARASSIVRPGPGR